MKYKFQNPIHRWGPCDECGHQSWDFRWPVTKKWVPTPQQKWVTDFAKSMALSMGKPEVYGSTIKISSIGNISVKSYSDPPAHA